MEEDTVEAKSKLEVEDKVAYNSSSCPNVTLSWRRLHMPYAVLVKGNQARREDYPNPKVEMEPNCRRKPDEHTHQKQVRLKKDTSKLKDNIQKRRNKVTEVTPNPWES